MKRIYIAHKFGGEQKNADRVADIIRKLIKQYPDYLFISPIHCTGFYYHDIGYDDGMQYCFELLSLCEEMWIFSEDSKGVTLEREYCRRNDIPVKEMFNKDFMFKWRETPEGCKVCKLWNRVKKECSLKVCKYPAKLGIR